MNTEWFEKERGITAQTLNAFGVRFESNGVVFPYRNGEKLRFIDENGKRRFKFTSGVHPCLFRGPNDPESAQVAFICEGETDTMRLWQELGEDVSAQVFGVGGVSTWKDEFAKEFDQYKHVFVILDNEDEYDNPTAYKQVEDLWLKIRRAIGPKAKRIRLRAGTQDLCEFFETFDMDDLRSLTISRSSRYKTLDLTIEPPAPDWLVKGIIARNDMAIFAGDGGLGKSWFTQALAVAVANGDSMFLGQPLMLKGNQNVLYFDEENPEDVCHDRLHRLGIKNYHNLRYIWNNGIRLDRNPEEILEEALDFQPTLIVVDSLSRVHGKEENSMGDMTSILNDALKPLARETGAAVVVIHHHDKGANGPRGTTDIKNAADSLIDAFSTGTSGEFRLRMSKSRRRLGGELMTVKITDLPDGSARLTHQDHITPIF